MAARARQLVATLPTQRQQPSIELPEYEQPQFALNSDAQRLLHNLTVKHKLDKFSEDLKLAISKLTNTATDVNERVSDQRHRQKPSRTANDSVTASQDGGRDEPASAAEQGKPFEQEAEKMTARMESSVRKMIDCQQSISWIRDSISATAAQSRAYASTQSSNPAASRASRRTRQQGTEDAGDGFGDDGQEEEYSDIEPTAQAESTQQQIVGPSVTFREHFELRQQRYRDTSLADRYTGNTDFRNYKNMVHHALYPDEDVAAPAPSTWFKEQPPARPGVTQGGIEEEEEEDMQMIRAVTSTKCPITLQEFKQPLTSNKCPHTYEASAIYEMIARSTSTRAPPQLAGRAGAKAVQCPVQGCLNLLTHADLHEDQVVVRRIRRLQRARELEDQEMQDAGDMLQDGTQRGALVIDEEGDDGYDVDDIDEEDDDDDDGQPAPSRRIKREMRASMK